MQPAQALNAIRTLTRQLASSRLSGAAAIQAEKPIWDALLGTIDSLLTSNDITTEIQRAGIGVKDVVRHVQSARGWIDYFFRLSVSNTMTHDQAIKYDAYKSRLLGSIDDTVSSIDREQNRVPQAYRAPWLNRAVAAVALTIAGYTGLAGTLRAEESVAQANKPVVEQTTHNPKDGPKKEERDYANEILEKAKLEKLVDGKTAEWYNNQGNRELRKTNYLAAISNVIKAKSMDSSYDSPDTNLGTIFVALAKSCKDDNERTSYLKASIQAYGSAISKNPGSKQYLKEEDRKANLGIQYQGLAEAQTLNGDKAGAMKSFAEAQKYGALTEQSKTLLSQISR